MKTWTQHQARAGNAAIPGGVDKEVSVLRASLQGLDRTQLPAGGVAEDELAAYASHRVWTSTKAEQTNVVDSDIEYGLGWAAVTVEESISGWTVFDTVTLTGHKGGVITFEWSGSVLASQLFCRTTNQPQSGNPNHIGLRVTIGGVVVAERIGPCDPHGSFKLVGSGYFPNGDIPAVLSWRTAGQGPDDPTEDVGNGAHILKAHLYASKFFAIGRFK